MNQLPGNRPGGASSSTKSAHILGGKVIKKPASMIGLQQGQMAWDPFADAILRQILRATTSAPASDLFECTLKGPVLTFHDSMWVALGGAEGSLSWPLWEALAFSPGETLDLSVIKKSCRIYLMLAYREKEYPGKNTLAAWRLKPESRLRANKSHVLEILTPESDGEITPGTNHEPQELRHNFIMSPASDRRGMRLSRASGDGNSLGDNQHGGAEIAPEPLSYGCIQLPPSGQPIIMGPASPKTGGYLRIGKVARPSLRHLAWLLPGDPVTFATTTRRSSIEQMISLEEALARDIVPC